ncbi:TspO/MBR family protein [Roseicella aquatilis]|nr:TspO/MBR family protein [Roseicella aquatilis]
MRQALVEQARDALVPRQAARVGNGDIATALAVCGGAVLASGLLAARWSPSPVHGRIRRDYERLEKPPFNPPDSAFAIWGPIYAALTVSGARLWNAPPSPARRRALAHWFGIQGLNALWMWLGFGQRMRGAATLEAAATTVNAVAYVEAARRVDRPAAWLAVPYAAWIGFAALLTEELWRRNRGRVE